MQERIEALIAQCLNEYVVARDPHVVDRFRELLTGFVAGEEPEVQAEAEPEVQAEAEPEVQAEAEPEVQAEAEPEVQAEAEPEVQAEAEGEASHD